MRRLFLFPLLALFSLVSCGPSEQKYEVHELGNGRVVRLNTATGEMALLSQTGDGTTELSPITDDQISRRVLAQLEQWKRRPYESTLVEGYGEHCLAEIKTRFVVGPPRFQEGVSTEKSLEEDTQDASEISEKEELPRLLEDGREYLEYDLRLCDSEKEENWELLRQLQKASASQLKLCFYDADEVILFSGCTSFGTMAEVKGRRPFMGFRGKGKILASKDTYQAIKTWELLWMPKGETCVEGLESKELAGR